MFLPEMRRLLQQQQEAMAAAMLNDTIEGSALDPAVDGLNVTGIFIRPADDEGLVDPEPAVGFTDIQTVFIALVITLLLLIFVLVTGICIRFVWTKFREGQDEGYRGVLQRDESSDPLGGKSQSTSGHLLSDELKISESQFSINPTDDIEDITHSPVVNYSNPSTVGQNHTSKSSNGSIITMTLKNNHLIVETEERCSGIPENSKTTTTTKFTASTSPHHNNVFVVEVQHASLEAGTSSYRDSGNPYPKLSSDISSQEDIYDIDEENEGETSRSQRVQVHQPPDGSLEDVEEDEEEYQGSTNTGLSQSDLSLSSAGSNNPSYRYGNQLGYDSGHYGYPEYIGYDATGDNKDPGSQSNNSITKIPLIRNQEEEEKHLKEQMKLGNWVDAGKNATSLDETKVKSSLYRQASLPQRLKEEENLCDRKIREEKVAEMIEKADTVGEIKSFKPALEIVEETNGTEREQTGFSGKKRASLPIITPELYTQIKQTKNMILDKASSPNFKKLQNDVSPLEDAKNGGSGGKCEIVENVGSKFGEHDNKTFSSTDE